MSLRVATRCLQRTVGVACSKQSTSLLPSIPAVASRSTARSHALAVQSRHYPQSSTFHTSSVLPAQSPTADALMENLTDLYATARDEFEIAAEETEKKTVYAADDREAAVAALQTLKEAFEKAVKESDPEVGKEIQSRVGQRIRELENAIKAMEQMAMED
ncbi:uncharacterized protein PV06_10784 [Exophiala oligosperma]|uniref:Uncharacterized protein n=2 Tax=Chaetothyriales TaxID=34395 RepID=A0A0D2D4A6_9EURO|nr:uncharacterized protein PV06_10784 [Exophiala oligosperma]KAJ9640266.1 hypothetical protein H2204_003491 [Knufia peltigerae]KIW37165.1 hypothetical protein PV06_10784 [Exophiala oligosperma]